MNNTIHNAGLTPPALQNGPQGKAGDASAQPAAQAATTRGDSVELTASARAIDQASRTHDSGAPVDSARVQRLRQAVASGNYSVDATRIADKLLQAERQINGLG